MENRKDAMYTDMAKKKAEKTEKTKETEKAREQEEKNMSQNKRVNLDNGEMTRRELKSRRTGSTKTFENSDHSFTTEIYLSPVHYQTEDGSWEEMDDTLTDVETRSETGNAAEKTQKKAADASAFINRMAAGRPPSQHTQTVSQPSQSRTALTPSPGIWSRQLRRRHAAKTHRYWSIRKSCRGSMQNTIPQGRQ